MDNKIKWLSFAVFVFLVISACGLLTNGLDTVEDIVSGIDEITDDIPVDEIKDEIEALVTDLPGNIEDFGDEIDTLVTDLPGELEDIEGEIDALATDLPDVFDDLGDLGDIGGLGDIGDLIDEGLGSGEAPSDIPIIDDPNDMLLESEKIISYLTSQDFNFVLDYYKDQMIVNGWEEKEGWVTSEEAALLYFEKPDREVTITISLNPVNDETTVMILIQTKD